MKRVNYFELDLPHCANTYGVAPCTAALTGNNKCFNSRASCQDIPNFRPGYPLVNSVTETLFAADTTAHSGFLPDGIAAGDLLLAIFANDGSATVTTPSGWTAKGTLVDGTNVRGSVFAKIAAGTEDATSAAGSSLASAGTSFGDMTSNGGNDAAFDGVTAQGSGASAQKTTSTTAYIGLTFPSAVRIHAATIYGSNNNEMVAAINPTVTVSLRGKTGDAPVNFASDGTQIGSVSFTDTADESAGRTITMTDQANAYDFVWAYITHNGAANNMLVAELTLTEGHPFASFATSATEAAALQVFHVLKNNWSGKLDDVVVTSFDTATSANPDPPSNTPGWTI